LSHGYIIFFNTNPPILTVAAKQAN